MKSLINHSHYNKNIREHYENKKCDKDAAYRKVKEQLQRILSLLNKAVSNNLKYNVQMYSFNTYIAKNATDS